MSSNGKHLAKQQHNENHATFISQQYKLDKLCELNRKTVREFKDWNASKKQLK